MDSMRTPLQTSSRSVFSRYQGSIQAENIPPGRIIDQTTITSLILPEGIIWSTRTLWNWPTTGFKCPQILFYSGSKTPNIASWVIQFSLRFIAIQGKAYFSSNRDFTTRSVCLYICLSVLWTIMDYYGLSWTIMDYHGLSWTIMDYQGLSCTVMHCHGLSLTVMDYHWLTLTIMDYCILSLAIMDYVIFCCFLQIISNHNKKGRKTAWCEVDLP